MFLTWGIFCEAEYVGFKVPKAIFLLLSVFSCILPPMYFDCAPYAFNKFALPIQKKKKKP